MERLKSELQGHGLKCGGTLQERDAMLFLLKSTPLDKLPQKLLAKKRVYVMCWALSWRNFSPSLYEN